MIRLTPPPFGIFFSDLVVRFPKTSVARFLLGGSISFEVFFLPSFCLLSSNCFFFECQCPPTFEFPSSLL